MFKKKNSSGYIWCLKPPEWQALEGRICTQCRVLRVCRKNRKRIKGPVIVFRPVKLPDDPGREERRGGERKGREGRVSRLRVAAGLIDFFFYFFLFFLSNLLSARPALKSVGQSTAIVRPAYKLIGWQCVFTSLLVTAHTW
jgi:hypothetical protein